MHLSVNQTSVFFFRYVYRPTISGEWAREGSLFRTRPLVSFSPVTFISLSPFATVREIHVGSPIVLKLLGYCWLANHYKETSISQHNHPQIHSAVGYENPTRFASSSHLIVIRHSSFVIRHRGRSPFDGDKKIRNLKCQSGRHGRKA